MTGPKAAEAAVPALADQGLLSKLSPALRKLLSSTPEKECSKIRAFVVESEEEGELVEMLPEVNRVMKYCPAKLMGRVGRREITVDQLDKAYTLLHDSIHGVKHALQSLLHLAGFREPRGAEDRLPPAAGGQAGDGAGRAKESAATPKAAPAPAGAPAVLARSEKS